MSEVYGHLTTVDHMVILAYLLASVGLGVWFTRRGTQDSAAFLVGSRGMPWWLVGFGLVATCFSSDGPLWIGDMIYRRGFEGVWMFWALGIGGAFFVFGVAPLWRRSGITTDLEFLEMRYSGRAASVLRLITSLFYSTFFNVMLMAISSLSIVTILQATTGWNKAFCLLITMGVAIVYFVASGLWGVSVTGFMQFFVYSAGTLILMGWSLVLVGGPEALATKLQALEDWQGHTMALLPRPWTPGGLTLPTLIVLVGFWSLDNAAQGMYVSQRLFACRNTRQATFAAMLFMGIFFSLVPVPWIITVAAAKVALPELTDGQQAYPRMAMFLPVGLRGLLVASLLAAFMSTYASLLSWGSAYFAHDFWRRFLVRNASEKHYVRVAQICMLPMAAVAGVIAYRAESILSLFLYLWLAYTGYLTIKVARWLWWRCNAWSEVSALSTSVVLTLALRFVKPAWFAQDDLEYFYGHRGLVVGFGSLVVWLVVTLVTKPVDKDVLNRFCERVRPFGCWGTVYRRTGLVPDHDWRFVLHGWGLMLITIGGPMLGVPKLFLGETFPGALLTAAGVAAAVLAVRKARKSFPEAHE